MATAAISIERFRRRRDGGEPAAQPATGVAARSDVTLAGMVVGTIDRRYGLMASCEQVCVEHELARSGDLAVADRLAFLAAVEHHRAVLVVEHDGWYVAVLADRAVDVETLAHLRSAGSQLRMMSLVTERGITPSLGPLCA